MFIPKIAGGKISGAVTHTLYPCPSGGSALMNNLRLINLSTSNSTPPITLMVQPASYQSMYVSEVGFTISSSTVLVLEDMITLGPGDSIRLIVGGSPTPNLDWVINVLERE